MGVIKLFKRILNYNSKTSTLKIYVCKISFYCMFSNDFVYQTHDIKNSHLLIMNSFKSYQFKSIL